MLLFLHPPYFTYNFFRTLLTINLLSTMIKLQQNDPWRQILFSEFHKFYRLCHEDSKKSRLTSKLWLERFVVLSGMYYCITNVKEVNLENAVNGIINGLDGNTKKIVLKLLGLQYSYRKGQFYLPDKITEERG